MALPYPHGVAAGQIGHGAQIDYNDTPGSTGGRMVGFGEEGRSRYNNRGMWALSANIDYIYQTYTAPKTVPGFARFESDGSDYYELEGSVFVGLSWYPGTPGVDELVGLSMIFMVLDEKWAALQDPVEGGEVRVTSVRDLGNVGTIYKDGDTYGFHTDARIGFSLCDPFTGEPLPGFENYEIPEGTIVNIVYGASSSLEGMPSDALLRTMIPRTGVPPGVILQNGTRWMLADLNMNGHELDNVTNINSGSNRLSFFDVYAHGGAFLSENVYGTTVESALPVGHTSILGQLNSDTKAAAHALHNRVYTKQASLTFDAVNSTVTVPAGDVYTVNGETFIVPDGDLVGDVPEDGLDYYMVIDHESSTVPVVTAIRYNQLTATLTQNMVIVAMANHSSSTSTFTTTQDLRTTGRHLAGKFEVYVGADAQCDFDDLQKAVNYVYANSLCLSASGLSSWRPRIVIRNNIQVEYVAAQVTFPANCPFVWEIVGEGRTHSGLASVFPGQAVIKGADDWSSNYNMVLNDNVIHFRRIAFIPGGGTSSGQTMLYRVGDLSTFEDCSFTTVQFGGSFANAVVQQAGADSAMTFRRCQFSSITYSAIYTYGDCTLEDCLFSTVGLGDYALVLGGGAAVRRCTFRGATVAGLQLGCDCAGSTREASVEVSDCMMTMVSVVLPAVTEAHSGRFTVQRNMFSGNTVGSWAPVYVHNTAGSISAVGTDDGAQTFSIKDNVFEGCYYGIDFDLANVENEQLFKVVIEGNAIRPVFGSSTSTNTGIHAVDAGSITVSNNVINGCGTGIAVTGGYAVIRDNNVSTASTGIATDTSNSVISSNKLFNCTVSSIVASGGSQGVTIKENLISGTSAIAIYVGNQSSAIIEENRIRSTSEQGIQLNLSDYAIVKGNWIASTTNDSINASTCTTLIVEGNTLQGTAAGYSAINLSDCYDYKVMLNTIRNGSGTSAVAGGGIYARRTGAGAASYGRISGNTLRYVLGEGPLAESLLIYAAIYFDSSIESPGYGGKTYATDNTLDYCGTNAGDGSTVAGIMGYGYSQVNNNMLFNPQGQSSSTNTFQYGIALMADGGPTVWQGEPSAYGAPAAVANGNMIIINNNNGQSGGITDGTFYGIYFSQHGTAVGNTVTARYNVTGGISSFRSPIFVETSYRVVVDANNVFGLGDVVNPAENITIGNLGVGATDADLTTYATGNSRGQGLG